MGNIAILTILTFRTMLTLIIFTSVFTIGVAIYVFSNGRVQDRDSVIKDLQGQLQDLNEAYHDAMSERDISYHERNRGYQQCADARRQRDCMIDSFHESERKHADTIMELQSLQAHHDACVERELFTVCQN